MKQTTFIAILLTLLMFLLVVAAGAVFLFTENQDLETETVDLVNTQEAVAAVVTKQARELDEGSNLLVAEAATRQALSGDLTLGQQMMDQLQGQLTDNETTLSQLQNSLAFQLLILSPTEDEQLLVDEPIELLVVAVAEDGLDSVAVEVNGQPFVSRLTEGLAAMALQEPWTPDVEGVHTISVTAQRSDGEISEPKIVNVNAINPSPEAIAEAMRQGVMTDVAAVRFPGSAVSVDPTPPDSQLSSDLHRRLLLGNQTYTSEVATNEALALSTFQFVPPNYDLHGFKTGLVEDDVTGYQGADGGNFTLYSYTEAEEPGAFDRWYYAHPYSHALLEKQLGAASQLGLGAEALMALRALAEGDALLTQELYQQSGAFVEEDRAMVSSGLLASASDALDGIPPYLRNQFEFAYKAGGQFINTLYKQGGLEAVDAVWEDLPRTTEHILHPERYLAGDAPKQVTITAIGEGWIPVAEDTIGEFMLREYLSQQLSNADLELGASGWGGGRYAVYQNEDDQSLVTVIRLEWDDPDNDRTEFNTAFIAYQNAALGTSPTQAPPNAGLCWGETEAVCLYPIDEGSLIVFGPDLDTVQAAATVQQSG